MLDWGWHYQNPVVTGLAVPGYTTGATAIAGYRSTIASETEFSIPTRFNGSEGIYSRFLGWQNGLI